jgi:uncharacterized protein with GYD domain
LTTKCSEEVHRGQDLLKLNYTPQGTKGLLKDGGSGRRNAVKQVIEGLGGKVEAG